MIVKYKVRLNQQNTGVDMSTPLVELSRAQQLVLRVLNDLYSNNPGVGIAADFLAVRLNYIAGRVLFDPVAVRACLHDLHKLGVVVKEYPQAPTHEYQHTQPVQNSKSNVVLWRPAGHLRHLIPPPPKPAPPAEPVGSTIGVR